MVSNKGYDAHHTDNNCQGDILWRRLLLSFFLLEKKTIFESRGDALLEEKKSLLCYS
jgi:hypothetical protein